MSYWKNRHEYFQLMENFINGTMNGVEFETKFYGMMRADRDRNLCSQCRCKSSRLESVLSRIFTACDVFNPDPTDRAEHEYNETELRNFVQSTLAESQDIFE